MFRRYDIEMNQIQRDEQLRQAETARAVQPPALPRRTPVYRPVLSWLGRRMVSAGFRLMIASNEWEHRARTMYNGGESLWIEPMPKSAELP